MNKRGKNIIKQLQKKHPDLSVATASEVEIDGKTSGLIRFASQNKKGFTMDDLISYVLALLELAYKQDLDVPDIIEKVKLIGSQMAVYEAGTKCQPLPEDAMSTTALYIVGYVDGLMDYYGVQLKTEVEKSIKEMGFSCRSTYQPDESEG